jgi:hypothetical protein
MATGVSGAALVQRAGDGEVDRHRVKALAASQWLRIAAATTTAVAAAAAAATLVELVLGRKLLLQYEGRVYYQPC